MKSWLSTWKNRRERDVEADLRASRPEPSARFVKSLANRVNPRPVRPARTRSRIGIAAVSTAAVVAIVGATGGFSSAASNISSFTHSITHSGGGSATNGSGGSADNASLAGSKFTSAAAQYGAAPTVNDDFSPNPAWPGAVVTVTGTNFSGINQITDVKIGAESAPFQVTGPTSLTVTVPSDSAGGPITVTNSTSPPATTNTPLEVVGAPTITHIATNGSADTAEGGIGSTVVITGTNFQTVTSVTFNKKAATVSSKTATSITVTIPVGTPTNTVAKPGSLVVTNPVSAATASYIVDGDAPTVTAIAIATGKKYARIGDTVTVTGKNLTAGTTLLFTKDTGGFIAGTSQAAPAGITNGTKWSAVVPSHAVTGSVEVSSDAGSAISKAILTVVLDASVSGFTPNFGAAGSTSTKPGDPVTITGTSLTSIATNGLDVVTFPGGATASAKPTGDTKLSVKVPFGAAGSGPLSVDNGSGTAGTSANPFYVLAQPAISAIDAADGTTVIDHGASGTVVKITGSHFVGVTSVLFNNVAVPKGGFTVVDDSHITTTVPLKATNVPHTNAGLVVKNKVGNATAAFTVDATAPTITKVTTHPGTTALTSAAVGDTIDITGAFLNTQDTVSFCSTDGATCGSTTVGTAGVPTAPVTTISVTIPSGATTGKLVVDNGTGAVTKAFTILSAPTLVAFSPGYGIAGTKVTITGDGLAHVTEVDFVGTSAPNTSVAVKGPKTGFKLNKDGSLTIAVPRATMVENELVLKTADPANSSRDLSSGSGNLVFDIVSKPANLSVNDLGHSHVAGQQIEIDGTNLQGITSVKFGKKLAAFAAVGNGSGGIDTGKLSVTIPSGATSGVITVVNAAAGGGVKTATFAILAVTKLSVTHALPGKPLTLTGSGFKPGGTRATVSINTTPDPTAVTVATSSSDTSLKLTVPNVAAGSYTLTITSSLGSVTTSFTVD